MLNLHELAWFYLLTWWWLSLLSILQIYLTATIYLWVMILNLTFWSSSLSSHGIVGRLIYEGSMSFHMKDEICFSRESWNRITHIMMEKVWFFWKKKNQKEDSELLACGIGTKSLWFFCVRSYWNANIFFY